MKKSKWLFPITIIISFLIILVFVDIVGVDWLKEYKNNLKEKNLQKEKDLAFDASVDFDNNSSNIIDIQSGDTYTAILKDNGTVWVTGKNSTYTSEYTYEGIKLDKFTKMRLDNIKQIGVGDEFVIALTNNGDVYSWGGNSYSELGIERVNKSKPYQVPRKVDIENIEKIYVFGKQVVALSKEGVAYYWGYAVDDYKRIVHTFDIKKVVDVFLTQSQYYFKTEDGEIYAVGFDLEGVTSQKNGWGREPILIDINDVSKIVSLNGYEGGNSPAKYILKKDGSVWILNTLKEGKLETKIEGLNNIEEIYPIKDRNSQESCFLAVDKDRNLYSYKVIGFIGEEITADVTKLPIDNVKEVKEKESMILILKQDGTLYDLGYSIDDLKPHEGGYFKNYYYEPKELSVENTKLVTVGKDFVIVIDNNNKMYRQGNNSNGELGAGDKEICQEIFITSPYEAVVSPGQVITIDPSMDTIDD